MAEELHENHSHFRIIFLFIHIIYLFLCTISQSAEEIDEIIVEANWREAKDLEEDSSVLILN